MTADFHQSGCDVTLMVSTIVVCCRAGAAPCHTVPMETIQPGRRWAFTALLFSTMGVGTFIAASLGIIAVVFITDLGISRAQLGFVFAINTVGAALLSPVVGRITDRIGGRSAMIVVASTAAVSFLVLGFAGSLVVLAVGSGVGAIAQAGSNPSHRRTPAVASCHWSYATIHGSQNRFLPGWKK